MAVDALWLQEGSYPARVDRLVFDALWDEGVLDLTSFVVSERQAGANMTVDVTAGRAVIAGDDQANQGSYLVRSDAATTDVTIAAAPGSDTRHDLIVLRVRDTNAGGPAGDDAAILVVEGSASSTPADPAVPDSAIVLARVRVPNGTASITDSLIDDLRVQATTKLVLAAGAVSLGQLDGEVSDQWEADISAAVVAALTGSWTTVTPASSWSTSSLGDSFAMRYKKVGNMVTVVGALRYTGSTGPTLLTATTLPAGFRPPGRLTVFGGDESSSIGITSAYFLADGTVAFRGPDSGLVNERVYSVMASFPVA